jgi:hypothetical protein
MPTIGKAIFTLTENILTVLNEVVVIFYDLAKAFDRVHHEIF